MDALLLLLAGTGTAVTTGLGAIPVSHLGSRADQLRPALWGLTVGLMSVASVVGLLLPALDEGTVQTVLLGTVTGVAFLLASRRLLRGREVHVGSLSGAGVRRSVLVFGVLLVDVRGMEDLGQAEPLAARFHADLDRPIALV